MITTQLPSTVDAYRMIVPRYASTPLSGAGATRAGGRFNRPGLEALYVSLEVLTAVAEYQLASPHLLPATLCSCARASRRWWTFACSTKVSGIRSGKTGQLHEHCNHGRGFDQERVFGVCGGWRRTRAAAAGSRA